MKTVTLLLILISLFALAQISELYTEFQRRDAIVLSVEQGLALSFLHTLSFDTKRIRRIQSINNDTEKFMLELNNGDICLGDIKTSLLRCKNEYGLTTVSYAGDSD